MATQPVQKCAVVKKKPNGYHSAVLITPVTSCIAPAPTSTRIDSRLITRETEPAGGHSNSFG